MTPLYVSIAGVARVDPADPRRPRADPQPPAARALRAALARDRRRAARPLRVARRPEHDRRLGRRHRLPAGGALRGRDALHPRRAAALLDGDLEARRPERDPRAAARAARAAASGPTRERRARATSTGGLSVATSPCRRGRRASSRRRRSGSATPGGGEPSRQRGSRVVPEQDHLEAALRAPLWSGHSTSRPVSPVR